MFYQAATFILNDVLLVVGDRSGDILKVVWVEYSDELLKSFRKCAKDILTLSTQFSFCAIDDSKSIEEIITLEERRNIEN